MSSQFALPLAWPADARDDAFLVTEANRQAVHLLDHWGTWPVAAALLTGPRKAGRSLIARIFAAKSGGRVIDDAERHDEAEIFHAWNEAQATRHPLLIVADEPPPAWAIALPDLRSRLAATPHAAIQPPDDAMMRGLVGHLLDRRGVDARPELVNWLARGSNAAMWRRCERPIFSTRLCSNSVAGCRSRSRAVSLPMQE